MRKYIWIAIALAITGSAFLIYNYGLYDMRLEAIREASSQIKAGSVPPIPVIQFWTAYAIIGSALLLSSPAVVLVGLFLSEPEVKLHKS